MKPYDLYESTEGVHLRILVYAEPYSYVVDCDHFRMPKVISNESLKDMMHLPADEYAVYALDEELTSQQRQQRNQRMKMLQGLLCEQAVIDKSYRNQIVRANAMTADVTRRTVLQYLWRYWVYQNKNALVNHERKTADRPLTTDERNIRWALNKFYYTPQKQTLPTAYKMMLQARYCDLRGKLLPEYPSFWQFRYYYRQHRDPANEIISREGIKVYQRNHRAFTGSVRAYTQTIGTYMTDATVADVFVVSRITRKPIGRPIIYTMVDAYSNLIVGVYVGLEGGQYALRLLLQNTCVDKVKFCRQHGIDISSDDWPSHHLPAKIMTDRGTEFLSGPLEHLCESYHIEIENLPAYRPDLKGPVEKLFDLIQSAYKPLLKGKGVIEPDYRERGAPDYRKQGILDLEQFTKIVLKCVLYYNGNYVQEHFPRTLEMIQNGVPPIAARIWMAMDDSRLLTVDTSRLTFTLLPRTEGKISQRGLEVFGLRYSNAHFKKRFINAGVNGKETVIVSYSPDCMDTIWLYEQTIYTPFALVQSEYQGQSLAEIKDSQRSQKLESVDWKKQELQAQLDLMGDISSITATATKSVQLGNIGKHISENRAIARKQEVVSMMDLLMEYQEEQ